MTEGLSRLESRKDLVAAEQLHEAASDDVEVRRRRPVLRERHGALLEDPHPALARRSLDVAGRRVGAERQGRKKCRDLT